MTSPSIRPRQHRYLIPALLVLAAVFVIFNAGLAFRAVDHLLYSQHWVEHTYQVINQVEILMGSAKDAETGTRGYILTGEEDYLQPYRDATRDLPAELDQFKSLTSDNEGQQMHVAEMRTVVAQRMDQLSHAIELRRVRDPEAVRAFILSGTGKAEMDHLRDLADDMVKEERRLLVIRTADAESDSMRARFTIAIASALDFLLIVFLSRYFARERTLRLQQEETAANLAESRTELQVQADEIRALNVTLEQRVQLRTAELEATNRELEAFSYSVSHDLRAPLRTIDGFSLALEEDYAEAVDDTGRDYIRRVRTGVQRMGQLIDALLQLSRITRADISRSTFSFSELAHSVATVLQDDNPSRPITFNIEDGLMVDGDPKLLQVALENLFGNAVKFSSKSPATIIDFGWDKEKEAWCVRDQGAGFDMFYASKLFNAFNRLHGDKDFKGSGIGLATVARVVHRHHGKIWADSVVDHGATFWFTLG
jgi:signal transduction histidine kinase